MGHTHARFPGQDRHHASRIRTLVAGSQARPKGTPNIVIVYMGDMGYTDVGCFGSEIETPHIDALAARGLRFNHYTTHPICSPARAALLTGRNAHAVGTGWLANNHAGFPGLLPGAARLDFPGAYPAGRAVSHVQGVRLNHAIFASEE